MSGYSSADVIAFLDLRWSDGPEAESLAFPMRSDLRRGNCLDVWNSSACVLKISDYSE
jgi:hypothetical protein